MSLLKISKFDEQKISRTNFYSIIYDNAVIHYRSIIVYENNVFQNITVNDLPKYNGYYFVRVYAPDMNASVILIKNIEDLNYVVLKEFNVLQEILENRLETNILKTINNKEIKSIKKQIADIIHHKVLWSIRVKTNTEIEAEDD